MTYNDINNDINSTKEVTVLPVSIYLSISRIMQKAFKQFSWNLVRLCTTAIWRTV